MRARVFVVTRVETRTMGRANKLLSTPQQGIIAYAYEAQAPFSSGHKPGPDKNRIMIMWSLPFSGVAVSVSLWSIHHSNFRLLVICASTGLLLSRQ